MSNLEKSGTPVPRCTVHWMHDRAITISVPGGYLNAAIGEGALYLTDFFVEPPHRGNGLAGRMLNTARELALDSGAARIVADLTSPEAVRAAQKVFGGDAVNVYASYPASDGFDGLADTPEIPAAAGLNYSLITPNKPA